MRDFMAWARRPHRGYSTVFDGGSVYIQVVRGGQSRRSRQRIAEVRIRLCDVDDEWRKTVARMLRKLREVLRRLKDGSW